MRGDETPRALPGHQEPNRSRQLNRTIRMTYLQKSGNKEKKCIQCEKDFVPRGHSGTKQFCSYHCSNMYKWKTRIRKPPKIRITTCQQCKIEFQVPVKYSLQQWSRSKFCSVKCAIEGRRIKDGMNRGERYRRKRGYLKQGSPEWLEKIRARTKEAMYRPEINAKIRKPRRSPSLESRIKHSNLLAGRLPKNMMFGSNGSYPNVQRGDYENSKGTMYFRSKWEANYALFLDFLVRQNEIKEWEYEADVFIFEQIQFGTRSYRPDFKVFNHNRSFEYHEVKGYMDSKSKTKLKRMAKYYPEVKIVLIDSAYYRDLNKKMGKILHFY